VRIGVMPRHYHAGSVFAWDQIAVPRAVRDHRIDVLFNPKYSIPLRAGCPAVWVCRGLDWYVMPWASKFVDASATASWFPGTRVAPPPSSPIRKSLGSTFGSTSRPLLTAS
jgi:hypothetical protein